MESIWSSTVQIHERGALKEDLSVEAAVIGAGMAGILTAYLLEESGVPVVVLEADRIGSGQTQNTTAKITSQHGLIYSKLIKKMGPQKARLYAMAQEAAISEYGRIIGDGGIKCHFEQLPSYLYSACQKDALWKEAQAAKELGLCAKFLEKADLPMEHVGAVCFEEQAQFHPLEFMDEISRGLVVYEKTKALSVKGNRIITNGGTVKAEHIIFASHYPFINVPGFYFAREHQERSYVIALENAMQPKGMYYSIDQGGLSLRNYENFLLVGGGAHRTGRNQKGGQYEELKKQAQMYFPTGKEVFCWSAQDCMPHDQMALIGNYSLFSPYWYVETGFHKWGMTSAMLSAMIIRDAVCGIENPYRRLFSPQRFYPRMAAGSFIQDLAVSVKELSKGMFAPEAGKIRKLRCPHMGCRLYWNEEEQSFDCPCHGSRFDKEGELLSGPAQKGCCKK